jgi:hypothetical protein
METKMSDGKRQQDDTSFACHKNSHHNKTEEKVSADAPQSKFAILHLPDAALSRVFSFLPLKIRVSFAMRLPVLGSSPIPNGQCVERPAKIIIKVGHAHSSTANQS